MEKIKCIVKLEGYGELYMYLITVPCIGHNIEYNKELYEVKSVRHLIEDVYPEDANTDTDTFVRVEKIEQKNILIHASKCKRL